MYINSSIFKKIDDTSELSGLEILKQTIKNNSISQFNIGESYQYNDNFKQQLDKDKAAIEKCIVAYGELNDRKQAISETMYSASPGALAFAQSMEMSADSITKFEVNQKKAQVSLDAQNKTWKNCTKLINEYNVGCINTGLGQQEFIESVSEGNNALGKYLGNVQQGSASTAGYALQLVKSKAATIGMTVATTAMNAAISMGVSLLIQLGITAIQHLAEEFKTTEEIIKETSEAITSTTENIATAVSDFQKLKDSVDGIAPKYAELAQGVDSLGNNINLTDSQYNEFLSLNRELATLFPDLVVGYNSNGEAILNLDGDVNTITRSLKNLLEVQQQVAAQKIVDEDFPTLLENIQKQSNAYKLEKDNKDKVLTSIETNKTSAIYMAEGKARNLLTKSDFSRGLKKEGMSKDDIEKLFSNYTKNGEIDWVGLLNGEELSKIYKRYQIESENAADNMIATWNRLKPALNSILTLDPNYQAMDNELQNVTSQIINSMDLSKLGWEKKSSEDISKWISSLTDTINTSSPEVQNALSGILKLDKSVTASEYKEQLEGFIDIINKSNLSDEAKASIKVALNTEDTLKQFETLKDNITEAFGDSAPTDDFFNSMSQSKLESWTNFWKENSKEGWESWAECEKAYEKYLNSVSQSQVDYLKTVLETAKTATENLQTALSESYSATGLSSESISNIENMFSNLEGYDTSEIFEATASGVKLNKEALEDLNAEYERIEKSKYTDALEELTLKYEDAKKELANCVIGTKEYNEALNNAEGIRNQINETQLLLAQYEATTSAYNKFVKSLEAGKERDSYESIAKSYEDMKKILDAGWHGDESLNAYLDLMLSAKNRTGDTLKDFKKLDETIKGTKYKITDFFKVDDDGEIVTDGLFNFLDTVRAKLGEEFVKIEDGTYFFDFTGEKIQKVSDELGISVELIKKFVDALKDADFAVDLESSLLSIYDLKSAAEKANDVLKNLGETDYTFNFNTTDIDFLKEEIEVAQGIVDKFKKSDGKINLELDGAEEAQGILATLLYQRESLETNSVIVQIEIEDPKSEIDNVVLTLQQFRSEYNRLKVETEVGADTTIAQENVDKLFEKIKSTSPTILTSLGIDTTNADSVIASIKSLSPEMLVSAGLDASLVENYDPESKSSVVQYNYDASKVDNWKPPTKYGTVIYTAKTAGGYILNKILGIGEAQGTANNSAFLHGTTGKALKQGDWRTKKTETALTGELGRELVVTGKHWYTVGDNGAEFATIPKGSIVFNHRQTEELFKNGKVTSNGGRGRVYASGTAFLEGTAYNNIGASGSGVKTGASGGSKSVSQATSSSKSSSKSSSSENEPKSFDWIEISISRLERAIDNLAKTANNAFKSLTKRNNAITKEIAQVSSEISLQQDAYNRYMQEANSVGLSSSLAAKVRDGSINISEYNEETSELISKYQTWYEKALSCSDAIDDLHESLAKLYKDNFDNVKTDFDNQLALYEHLTNTYNNGIDELEESGYLASKKYYSALLSVEEQNITVLNKELADLEKAFSEAMASGEIDEYSEEWYGFQTTMNGVKEEIQEANTELIKLSNSMRTIDWDRFDYLQDNISQITSESDFMIDLMGYSDLYNKQGQLNDNGMATMGLHGVNYNVYMNQADQYAKEINRINKEIAENPYDTELLKRREELLELQRDSILAAEDEKQAMIDLVEEGIQIELSSLKELIDTYNDALDSAKDLYDYQKRVAEHTEEISSLKKQLSAYAGDDSEENQARLQKLRNELKTAEEDLQETEYDKYISDQKKLLDNIYTEYETVLNQRMDDIDATLDEMIDSINDNSASINNTISDVSDSVGYTLTDNMQSIWDNSISGVITKYGDGFSEKLTNVNTVLSSIQSSIAKLTGESEKKAAETVSKATTTTTPTKSTTSTTTNTAKPTTSASGGDGKAKVGDKVTFSSGKYYNSSDGMSPLGNKNLNKSVYITKINTAKWATHPYHISTGTKLGKGDLGWVKLNQLKGYKTGGIADYTGLAWLDGTPQKPETILNAEDSQNFIALTETLREISNKGILSAQKGYFDSPYLDKAVSHNLIDISDRISALRKQPSNIDNSKGDIYVNIDIEKVEDYNDFVSKLQKDKNFSAMIRDETINLVNGGSRLAKNKYKW